MEAIQTGSNIRVTYLEPTTNSDGSPLADLTKTEVEADWGSGFQVVGSVQASSQNGGGQQAIDFTVPVNTAGAELTVKIRAFAFDDNNNKSEPSQEIVLSIDTLAPAPPQ